MIQKASIGRIVHFKLTAKEVERINTRRDDARDGQAGQQKTGFQVHVGNEVREGDVLPMLIVRVWEGDMVNGQVFLDGNDTLWVTSIHEGSEAGQYSWPTLTR